MMIMIVISMAIFLMLSTNLTLSRTGTANVAMLTEVRWALDTIAREAKYATSAQVVTTGMTGMPNNALGEALILTFEINTEAGIKIKNTVSYYYKADKVLYRRSDLADTTNNIERPLTNPDQAAFEEVTIDKVKTVPIKFTFTDRKLMIECVVSSKNAKNQVQTESLETIVYLLNQ